MGITVKDYMQTTSNSDIGVSTSWVICSGTLPVLECPKILIARFVEAWDFYNLRKTSYNSDFFRMKNEWQ